jgi:uncharacterized membrane protein YbhN (UPF0104 family)
MKAILVDLLRSRGLLLALLLGLGLLAATIFFTRPFSIFAQLNSLGPWGFLALLLSFGLSFLCNAKGWGYLLRAQGLCLSFSAVLRISCASFAFSYLIPSFNLAGEPIRIMLAAQKLRGEEEKILATVVLEKLLFFGIAVVFLLGAAATVMTQNLPPFLHQGLFSLAGAGAVLMSLALTILFGLPSWTPRWKCLPKVSSFWPGGFQGAVWEIRRSFSRQWSELFKAFLAITFGLALSSLTPFLFFFFAEGKLLPLPTLVSFLGLTTFFSLLWFTPAGLGVAEGGYAATFGLLGLPVGEAVTFALVQRLVALPVIVLGLFYLGRQGIVSWRRGSDG